MQCFWHIQLVCLPSFLSMFSSFLFYIIITKAWTLIIFHREMKYVLKFMFGSCPFFIQSKNSRDFSLLVDFVVVVLLSGKSVHSTDDSAVQGGPLLIADLPPFAPVLQLHKAFCDGYALDMGWYGSYTDFFHPFFKSLKRKKQNKTLLFISRIPTIFPEWPKWNMYSGHVLK